MLQVLIDVRQCLTTVDRRFPGTEQIQVWAVQYEDVLRHCVSFLMTDRLFTLKSAICPLKRHFLIYKRYIRSKENPCYETLAGMPDK